MNITFTEAIALLALILQTFGVTLNLITLVILIVKLNNKKN